MHGGELWAAGRFTHAGKLETGPLARWNGLEWKAERAGFARHFGLALYALADDGDQVFVAGNMDSVAGEAAPGLARFDGAAASPLSDVLQVLPGPVGIFRRNRLTPGFPGQGYPSRRG